MKAADRVRRLFLQYRRQVWVQIEAQRQAAGYKPGWSYRFFDRFGVAPDRGRPRAGRSGGGKRIKAEVYREFLRRGHQKLRRAGRLPLP